MQHVWHYPKPTISNLHQLWEQLWKSIDKYMLNNSNSLEICEQRLIRSMSNKVFAEFIDRCLILPLSAPLPEKVGRSTHQQRGILQAQQQQRLWLISWLTSPRNDFTYQEKTSHHVAFINSSGLTLVQYRCITPTECRTINQHCTS